MRRFSARDFFSLAPLQNWFKRNEFSFLCIASHRIISQSCPFISVSLNVFWSVGHRHHHHQQQHFIESICSATASQFLFILHHIISAKAKKKPEIVGKFSVFVCALCILSQLNGKRSIKLHLTLKAKFILLLLPQRKFITTNALRLPCHFAAVVHYFVSIFCMPSFVRIMVGFQWNSDELRCTLCSGHYH